LRRGQGVGNLWSHLFLIDQLWCLKFCGHVQHIKKHCKPISSLHQLQLLMLYHSKTLHLARYVSFPHTLKSDSAGRKRHKPLSMVNLAHGCVPKMCTAFIKRRAGAKAIFDENKALRSSSQTVPRAMRLRQESSSNDSQLMKLAQCCNHGGRCGLPVLSSDFLRPLPNWLELVLHSPPLHRTLHP
jgi:hypothetical protein